MSTYSDLYKKAKEQLESFENYIKELPDMESLIKSPIEAVFVDMTKFEDIARVLSSLREFTNAPRSGGSGFFNNNNSAPSDVNLSQVTALEERYAATLELYGQKAKVPNMERIIESIIHHLQLYTADQSKVSSNQATPGV